MTAVTLESEGLMETLKAFQGLEADLRKEANAELRAAAKTCAGELANALKVAAAGSPTPVAARVAKSIKVKSDRIPVVSIGGSRKVGRYGAPAAALVSGSEDGGKNFGAPKGGAYWIAPTVERFGSSGEALRSYRGAVDDLVRKWGLG
jgi:hypothetical protein